MSLKLEFENNKGKVCFDIRRNVSLEYLVGITTITNTLLGDNDDFNDNDDDSDSSFEEIADDAEERFFDYSQYMSSKDTSDVSGTSWVKHPSSSTIEEISDEHLYGSYVEPPDGVRIRILHCENMMDAIRSFTQHTGIKVQGCKRIIEGKMICPKLVPEVAESLIANLKKKDNIAKIIMNAESRPIRA